MNYKRLAAITILLLLVSTTGTTTINTAEESSLVRDNTDIEINTSLPIAGISLELNNIIKDTKNNDTITIEESEIVTSMVPNNEESSKVNIDSLEIFKRYSITNVNIRRKPSTNSEVVRVTKFNEELNCATYNDDWYYLINDNEIYYISNKYLSSEQLSYRTYNVPSYNGWKSWMPYTAITSTSSLQYKLQHNYGYTGNYGIRMVNDRYCVALGSYFNCKIGQYFTLVLQNGTKIDCIMSDSKSDCDTDQNNIFTSANGCMSEFIVSNSLSRSARNSGNISSCCDEWDSSVIQVLVYDKNIFD